MAPHSSTLAWKIPWMEEPGRLQSMGSLRVRHGWVTSLSLLTVMHWRRKWQPTPVFLPGEAQGRGSLVGCRLWGHTSRTRLKRLSSSSSSRGGKLQMGSEMAVESRGPLNGALGLKFSKEKWEWQVDSMKSTRNSTNPLLIGGQVASWATVRSSLEKNVLGGEKRWTC